MSDTIYWILAVKINPGQLEVFKAVAAKLLRLEMKKLVKQLPGKMFVRTS